MLRSDLCDYSDAYIVIRGDTFIQRLQVKILLMYETGF